MHDRIPFFLALCSSVLWFQMPFEGLGFVKTLVKFGIDGQYLLWATANRHDSIGDSESNH